MFIDGQRLLKNKLLLKVLTIAYKGSFSATKRYEKVIRMLSLLGKRIKRWKQAILLLIGWKKTRNEEGGNNEKGGRARAFGIPNLWNVQCIHGTRWWLNNGKDCHRVNLFVSEIIHRKSALQSCAVLWKWWFVILVKKVLTINHYILLTRLYLKIKRFLFESEFECIRD